MNSGKFVRGLVGAAALATCGVSQAAYTAYAYQNGPNVEMRGGGSINLAALAFVAGGSTFPQINPSNPNALVFLGSNPGTFSVYNGATGPTSYGPGVTRPASGGSGTPSGILGAVGQVLVPAGYVSGSALSAAAVWNGETIAGLGMTPGTYKWTWGAGPTADSFTLVIGSPPPSASPASIPTLSEWGLIGLTSLMAMFGIGRMRRRQA